MFIAALLVITKNWDQFKCPSTDKWLNKLWYIHTMEYYSALKRNELLIYTTTCMNLQEITMSKKANLSAKTIQWEKNSLFNKWCWNKWTSASERMRLDSYLTPYTRMHSKWIKDLNVRAKTIKLLEKNKGKSL